MSPAVAATIGIVDVACRAACTPEEWVTMTSTLSAASSLASAGRREFIAVGIAKFETQVLPLDIAEVAKPLPKFAADPLRPLPSVGYAEIADRDDPFRRLRGRRERPCHRPAGEADEFASSHSITPALDEVARSFLPHDGYPTAKSGLA